MNEEQLHTLADLRAFLAGTVARDFTVTADERYEFIASTVRRFGYPLSDGSNLYIVLGHRMAESFKEPPNLLTL